MVILPSDDSPNRTQPKFSKPFGEISFTKNDLGLPIGTSNSSSEAAATGDFATVVRKRNHPTKPIQVSVVKNMHLDGKQVFLVSRVCEVSDYH